MGRTNNTCVFNFATRTHILRTVTVDMFKHEIAEAMKMYDKYIVCVDKTPDQCEGSLRSLMEKAIKAYENRGPHLRHGIALDRQITIILSQTDNERPALWDLFQPLLALPEEVRFQNGEIRELASFSKSPLGIPGSILADFVAHLAFARQDIGRSVQIVLGWADADLGYFQTTPINIEPLF